MQTAKEKKSLIGGVENGKKQRSNFEKMQIIRDSSESPGYL